MASPFQLASVLLFKRSVKIDNRLRDAPVERLPPPSLNIEIITQGPA